MDLKLDSDEDFPRRLVPFPNGQLLAYGGEDGTVTCLDVATQKVRLLKEYDEAAVRAIAISSDGKRVAVGFDNGSTSIYHFDEYELLQPHPFVPSRKRKNGDDSDDDDGEEEDKRGSGFLSQHDFDDDDYDDNDDNVWTGPQLENAVRDMRFLPNSYWLAIASESLAGLCVVNVTSLETMADRHLQHQVEKEHDACGIRGVAVISDKGDKKNNVFVASLALDGRLCVWQAGGMDQRANADETVPCYRDENCCVPKKDVGMQLGADCSDQSCLPHWVRPGVLALPGKAHLQLRSVDLLDNGSFAVKESTKQDQNSDPARGHIESIVALASVGEHIVSSGRDGKVILWKLQTDEDGPPTAQFVEKLGQYESIPTCLHWNEDNQVLYIVCQDGLLQTVSKMDKKLGPKKAPAKNSVTKESSSKSSEREDNTSNVSKKTTDTSKATKAKSTLEESDGVGKDESTAKAKKNEPKLNELMDSDDEETSTMETSKKTKDPAISKQGDRVSTTKNKKKELKQIDFMDSDDEENSTMEPSKNDKDAAISEQGDRVSTTKNKKKELKQIDFVDSDDEENSTMEPSKNDKDDSIPKQDDRVDTNAMAVDSDDDLGLETQHFPATTGGTADMESDEENEFSSPLKKGSTSPAKKENSVLDTDAGTSVEVATSPSANKENEEEHHEKNTGKESSLASPTSKGHKRLMKQSKSDNKDDDDDDDDDLFDNDDNAATMNHDFNPKPKNAFIDDEAEDDDDDVADMMPDEAATQDAASKGGANDEESVTSPAKAEINQHDSNNHDDDDGFQNYDNGDDDDENSLANDVAEFNQKYQSSRSSAVGPKLPEQQAAFAPSSTPLDLTRRFLCWNNVGSITLMQGEQTGRSTVDVHFTDSAFRRPVSFTDNMGFILGSLGDDGGIFATDLAHDEDDINDEDDDMMVGLSLSDKTKAALKKSQKQRMRKGNAGQRPTGSSIFFNRFEPQVGNIRDKDWYLTLPDGERVLGCACGLGWAAVVTSRKFLRLFTSGGAQGQILWLPGNPVTVVGRNRFLAVFYHEGLPLLDGTQRLGYMLYDAISSRTLSKGSLSCISNGSSLSWAGFSNDFSLMAMDSDGMLSMLFATSSDGEDGSMAGSAQPSSWEWSPLLDTIGLRKSTEDSYWPVTVYDGKLVCIPLKGGVQYPDAGRRPITATIGMKMPFARSTLAKTSALEELCVRSNMALVQKKVNNDLSVGELLGDDFEDSYRTICAQVDKVTLKLFAATVEAGKLERALDLVHRFQLEKSYEIAMVIADKHDKLVDFIEEAKENRFSVDVQEEEGNEEFGDDVGYDENNGNSSPQGDHYRVTQKISPDADHASKSKRALDNTPDRLERSVRSRVY